MLILLLGYELHENPLDIFCAIRNRKTDTVFTTKLILSSHYFCVGYGESKIDSKGVCQT